MKSELLFRKTLSAPALFAQVRSSFSKVSDHRKKAATYQLVDVLMSGLAVFSLKFPSLLQFDRASRHDEQLQENLKTLFQLETLPSDTTVREILDEVDTKELRAPFKKLLAQVQRSKDLEAYQYFQGAVLLSLDGTSYFSSHEVHCDHCCVKNHHDGKVTFYHQMLAGCFVHPDLKAVLPIAPEPIIKQDGAKKNDCERNASQRLLTDFRREHPHLDVIVVEDSLSANVPHVKLLRDLRLNFILSVKSGDHTYLFEAIDDTAEHGPSMRHVSIENGIKREYQFINGVPLTGGDDTVRINFLRYWETSKDNTVRQFSWISDYTLSVGNVEKIMKGGRARWKIENETFNTLKNHGYQFEHNFGHGKNNLSANFALLMMLAFMIDQIQALSCKAFKRAVDKQVNKKAFWEKMRGAIFHLPLQDWGHLWDTLAFGFRVTGYTVNTT